MRGMSHAPCCPHSPTLAAPRPPPGLQIDIGAEFDGLLPCQDEQWEEVGDELAPGTEITVRVHRVRDSTLYRFPIQVR